MHHPTEYPLLVFVVSFIALWLSAWAGWVFRRWQGSLDDEMHEDFGFILAATLTLLGLIIGFSFSMATTRYDQRKNYEEAEANAIGTEYVRADLLPDPPMRPTSASCSGSTSTSEFCSTRAHDEHKIQQINARTAQLQTELWSAIRAPARGTAKPRDGPGRFGHERCIELAGIHPGCVLESNPNCGMGLDGSNRHRLQLAGRLWFAKCQGGSQVASDSAAYRLYRVHADSGHRLPAPRCYSSQSAESDQPS